MSACLCPARAQTSISLPFITATADGPKHIETNLSRAKFEELAGDLLDRCRVPVEQALKDANLSVKDLNEVILVGGSTRIPAVQVLAHTLRNRQPQHKDCCGWRIHPPSLPCRCCLCWHAYLLLPFWHGLKGLLHCLSSSCRLHCSLSWCEGDWEQRQICNDSTFSF